MEDSVKHSWNVWHKTCKYKQCCLWGLNCVSLFSARGLNSTTFFSSLDESSQASEWVSFPSQHLPRMQPSPFPSQLTLSTSPGASRPYFIFLQYHILGQSSLTVGISSIIKTPYPKYKCLLKTLYGPLWKPLKETNRFLVCLSSVVCHDACCPLMKL